MNAEIEVRNPVIHNATLQFAGKMDNTESLDES